MMGETVVKASSLCQSDHSQRRSSLTSPRSSPKELACLERSAHATLVPPGTLRVGVCKEGFQICSGEGAWGPCAGEVHPLKEWCDGRDNDCNGKIDDPLPSTGKCASFCFPNQPAQPLYEQLFVSQATFLAERSKINTLLAFSGGKLLLWNLREERMERDLVYRGDRSNKPLDALYSEKQRFLFYNGGHGSLIAQYTEDVGTRIFLGGVSTSQVCQSTPCQAQAKQGLCLGGVCWVTSNQGHTKGIWDLALDDEEGLLASASEDQTVKLWDIAGVSAQDIKNKAKPPLTTLLHSAPVVSVAFAPKSTKRLVTITKDKTLHLWDCTNRGAVCQEERSFTLTNHRPGLAKVSFLNQNTVVILSGTLLEIWDLEQKKMLRELKDKDSIRTISIDRTRRWLCTVNKETVLVWDLSADPPTSLEIRDPYDTIAHATMIDRENEAPLLVTVANKRLRVWELPTGRLSKLLQTRFEGNRGRAGCLSVSPDGRWFVTCEDDGKVFYVWDLRRKRVFRTLQSGIRKLKYSRFLSTQNKLLMIGEDASVELWDVRLGKRDIDNSWGIGGPDVVRVALAQASGWLALGGRQGILHLLNVKSKKLVSNIQHTATLTGLSFSSDGRWLAVALSNQEIDIYDTQNIPIQGKPKPIASTRVGRSGSVKVQFSADGTSLFAISRQSVDTSSIVHVFSFSSIEKKVAALETLGVAHVVDEMLLTPQKTPLYLTLFGGERFISFGLPALSLFRQDQLITDGSLQRVEMNYTPFSQELLIANDKVQLFQCK